jgi:hypothetical protein
MIWGANMKLTKLKVFNYRSFGNEEQIVPINELTTFIGSNSTGKTAALCALNCIFSTNSNDRVLQRSDFHLPKDTKPDELEKQELYIEAIFTFEELKEDGKKGKYSIPPFFQSMVVGGEGEVPYLRIRLEATWEKSNNVDGSIESRVMYITVATLLYRPIITLVACHRINRYNDMRTEKGKGFRTLIFCREACPETFIKAMVIISKYEVEYKEDEDIFNQQ